MDEDGAVGALMVVSLLFDDSFDFELGAGEPVYCPTLISDEITSL
jgi:hypothetical protein